MVHGNGQTCHLLLITTENNLEVKTKTLLITVNFIVCSFNELFLIQGPTQKLHFIL